MSAPTIEETRDFLYKQIAEVRATGLREGEDVTARIDDMLDKLNNLPETLAFIEQVTR